MGNPNQVSAGPPEQKLLTLRIDGMTCNHCVSAVTAALRDVQGIEVRKVAVGSAEIAVDPAVTTEDAAIMAVQDAGYQAHVEPARD